MRCNKNKRNDPGGLLPLIVVSGESVLKKTGHTSSRTLEPFRSSVHKRGSYYHRNCARSTLDQFGTLSEISSGEERYHMADNADFGRHSRSATRHPSKKPPASPSSNTSSSSSTSDGKRGSYYHRNCVAPASTSVCGLGPSTVGGRTKNAAVGTGHFQRKSKSVPRRALQPKQPMDYASKCHPEERRGSHSWNSSNVDGAADLAVVGSGSSFSGVRGNRLAGSTRPSSKNRSVPGRLLPFISERQLKSAPQAASMGKYSGGTLVDSRRVHRNNVTDMAKSSYNDHHRQDLRHYVLRYVELEEIKSWLLEKMSKAQSPTDKDLSKSKYGDKEMITELVKNLTENTSEDQVIWELAKSITRSVQVDAYRVYKLPPEQLNCALYFDIEAGYSSYLPQRLVRADDQQVRWLLEAAKNGSCLRLGREEASQFPDTPQDLLSAFDISDEVANYLLYQPILTTTGNTSYVIEMWRLNVPFTEQDEETSANCTAWGTLALHFRNQNLKLGRDRIMSDFLIEVVKALFEDMGSLDQLIKRILEYAQKLVNADRASLFLVDYRNFELVSTVFDLKFDPRQSLDVEKKEIRIPINRGIAGYVALSGEIMNIPDAYSDDRFNRDIDKATGYKTVSILCMPVKVKGRVIGVVQMVNKRTDKIFRREDEVAFQIFATFFGLALHHAKLYEKILRKEQKYRVALEVLSYHITCKENEVAQMLEDLDDFPINLEDFHLDSHKLSGIMKCKALIVMMDDLFDMTKFDLITVARFILTVKKNYRDVPYHNYDHGWSVAQCMYMILKNDDRNRYSYNMRLALFIACLCHDLDHRGLTNKYTNDTASPLAAMYTTSPLEHHHFNTAVTILQQEGHNIFAHFPTEDYKEILVMVRQNILATDLAAFFPNLSKMHKLLNRDSPDTKFDWAEPGHRDLAMAISMTAADLSAGTKPWKTHIKTVQEIFDEFYNQGDKEKVAGREPLPMMDREKAHLLPSCQVDFLTQICIPGFKVLYRLIPKTKPMLMMALTNLHLWKAKVVKMKQNLKENTLDHIYEDEFVDFDAISKEILLEEVEAGVDADLKTSNDDDNIVISKKEADKNVSPNEFLKEVGEMVPSEDEEDVVMAKNRMHDLANNDFDVEYD